MSQPRNNPDPLLEDAGRLDSRLTKLLEISSILAGTNSVDELTRQTVELAVRDLDFERIGLWFYDERGEHACGSFGVDEQGQIRDERGCRVTVNRFPRMVPGWETTEHVSEYQEAVLRDNLGRAIGTGAVLRAPLWDGHHHIGYMNVDRLFSRRSFTENDRRIFGLLATLFGNIYAVKRREQELVETQDKLKDAIAERDEALRVVNLDLKASEYQFRSLAETMSAAIVIFQGSHTIFVNTAAQQMTGFERQELEGMHFWQVVHPEEQEQVRQRGLARQESPGIADPDDDYHEVRIRTKDGQDKWVAWCASRIELNGQAAVLGCAIDISEQKRALRELEESREGFRILAEAGYEGIAIHDQGVLLQANDRYFAMFGYRPDEMLNKNIIPLAVAPESREFVAQRIRSGDTQPYETMGARKDGTTFPVEVRSRTWQYCGREARVAILHDLTERKKREEALRHTQKMQTVGTLAGGLAHDFNNLLMTMGGHLDRLAPLLPADSPGHDHLAIVRRAVTHAAGITRALLTFSHRSPIQKRLVNLAEVCHDVSRLLGTLLPARIQQTWDIPSSPVMVKTDPCLIQQVLMNLLLNARDAMPDGGEIQVSLRTAENQNDALLSGQSRGIHEERRYAELRVRDCGTGISEELRPRIFEPFVTTKARERGTGLGLSVTYAIVQEHGGWIHVDSQVGRGSTFTVCLPIEVAEEELNTRPACDDPRLDGLHILLVEDDEMVLALLRDTLAESGARVTAAETVESAMERLEEIRPRLDAAVVDLDLPDGRSRDLFLRIREKFPEARRLILSGGALDRSLLGWADEQKIPFLLKPFRLHDLSRTIHDLANRQRLRNNDTS